MTVFNGFAGPNLVSFQGGIQIVYPVGTIPGVQLLAEGFIQVVWGGFTGNVREYEGAFYVVRPGLEEAPPPFSTAYHRREGVPGRSGIPSSYYISTKRGSVLEVLQNTARNIYVFMRALDTGAGLAGLTPSMVVKASKNGGVGSTITPTITDLSSTLGAGWYLLALTGPHLDTLGEMALHITALAALDNDDVLLNVIAINKQDSVRAGITSLPNANASAVGGLAVITAIGQGPGGQIKANSFNDKYVYDTQGRMTSCRMRVFANKATADTASDTDADNAHGEVERFRVTVTYNVDGTIKTYEYAKEL